MRQVDFAFWTAVGSPPPARIGDANLVACPIGTPLTSVDLPARGAGGTAPPPAAAPSCVIADGAWVQTDPPSHTVYFKDQGKLRYVRPPLFICCCSLLPWLEVAPCGPVGGWALTRSAHPLVRPPALPPAGGLCFLGCGGQPHPRARG